MNGKDKPFDVRKQSLRVVVQTGPPNDRQVTEDQQRTEEREFHGPQKGSESR